MKRLTLLLILALCLRATAVEELGADSSYKSSALEKSVVVTQGRGRVNHVVVYNHFGADFYLLAYDTNAVPADGTAADYAPLLVPSGKTGTIDFQNGHPFKYGVTVVASTTDLAKTNLSANGAWWTVSYTRLGE